MRRRDAEWRWPSVIALVALLSLPAGARAQVAPPFEIIGETFVALRVEDADRSAAWYRSTFDLEEANRLDGADHAIRILHRPGLMVELIEQPGVDAPPERHLGLFKAGIFVRDIDAVHRRMTDLRLDADNGVFVDEALSVRSFVMRDPDGNRIQFFEPCVDRCGEQHG